MSRYCVVKTQFRDKDALIQALIETGNWLLEQIEVSDIPQSLYGYHGDVRKQRAHIIIRRAYVGRSSNDIGFLLNEDGNYEAIISEFDSNKYGEKWVGQLKGNYAYRKLLKEMEEQGRAVSRTRCAKTGRQRLEITGYR